MVIEIHVPPKHEIVVRREPGEGDLHDPLDSVLRNAFDATRRQLQELVERQRGETKKHPEQEAVAIVGRLFPEEDHGFIKTLEGQEIYFHRNSVAHDDFDRLEIGTGVRYVAKEAEKGLQASTVHIVDKPGSRTSN
ncbi:MAG: cold shock domain-containing protein [Aliifodinibius sp.]|nr:cold shock domain-containing protein [Fodinibius sp.]